MTHHFPNIDRTFKEISRVVKSGGVFFVSDPKPNENDDILDIYMNMKDDEHVKFYIRGQFIELAEKYNFKLVKSFSLEIRFPSNRTEKYLIIANTIDKQILDSYNIDVINGENYITEQVISLCR
ncbi:MULTISPECIES: methyltransferase domain-containing protein [Clostridium]|uniref:methyltransferase domain-containing protein n=1 Tax=Clostridium TaxID=1485 RepID=UPI0023BA050F|nr:MULTISPECIES: methyltransferase domain-containing protein [Clostridium]